MRFYMIRGRCVIFAVILLLLISLPLTACFQPENPDLSHIEGTECPDEKILEHIEKDFADYLSVTSKYDPERDGMTRIERCYGTYDGCVAIMFSMPEFAVLRNVEIAGSVFHYGGSNSIYVWKAGEFSLIEEAYAKGLVTAEQIAIIADIHNNRNYG